MRTRCLGKALRAGALLALALAAALAPPAQAHIAYCDGSDLDEAVCMTVCYLQHPLGNPAYHDCESSSPGAGGGLLVPVLAHTFAAEALAGLGAVLRELRSSLWPTP